jgi:hypothetical protein
MTFSDDLNFGPNVEGRAEPYGGVGDELRLLREQQGHTLGDVAETLRISARYLRAIEEGDLEKLPGPAYVLGFLRTYSQRFGNVSKCVALLFPQQPKFIADTPIRFGSALYVGTKIKIV